jgi:hypothetical protein
MRSLFAPGWIPRLPVEPLERPAQRKLEVAVIRLRKIAVRKTLSGFSVVAFSFMLVSPAFAQFFANRSQTQLGTSAPISMAAADFNKDGRQDLAVVDGGVLWILMGNGDGTFQTPVSYTLGTFPISVTTADLNGDGIPDLVIPDGDSKVIYLLIGNGDGTFQITEGPSTSSYPSYAALVALTPNHSLDLLVMDSPYITVFLNQGNGTWGSALNFQTAETPHGVAWGDFAGNGTIDLAVAEFEGYGRDVTVLLGNGDGTFLQGPTYAIGDEPLSVVAADFRGDGKLDLAVGGCILSSDISVLLGNGDGTFQAPVLYPAEFCQSIVAADVSGGGKPDLVTVGISVTGNGSGGTSVLLGNGDGTFQPAQGYTIGLNAWSMALADMNGDQKPDMIVGMEPSVFTSQYVDAEVLLNTGVLRFSPAAGLTFSAQLIGTQSGAQTATLTNEGTTTLSFSSVVPPKEPFAAKTTCKGDLEPGANCTITAKFTPTTQGTVTGTVTLKDTASSKPQVLSLLAAGTVLTFDPASLTFPSQQVGTESKPMSVQVTNTGSTAVNFTGITLRGNFSQTNTCGSQIGAGASCSISVTFKPEAMGLRTGYVTVNDTGGGSPQYVHLKGTGT